PDLPKLEARIQMLQTSGGTEIFQGLEKAFSETRRYLSTSNVNHIILITDGRTYGDEENCLALAQEAVGAGVGISGLGIGDEWNDILLDELARRTGGSSLFVSNPKDIQNVLLEKFSHLWQVFAEDVTLEFRKMETASLRYAFRLKPEVGLLALESPLRLGPALRDGRLSVLLEFLVGPAAVSADIVPLLDGELQAVLPSQSFPLKPAALRMARPVAVEPAFDPPPQEIIQALSRLTLYRLQEQARLDLSLGSYNLAAERLQRLATHLLQRGKTGLARTVLLEAENVQFNKRFSSQGDKSIKYGTRALASAGEE
ncbi:MAG: VWA domain-containing protein, partial [Chloroflexi bacterium]|nr:VWA domain-containing protein [Chloroflexota bacterium]